MSTKAKIITLLFLGLVVVGVGVYKALSISSISSFDECVAAGFPVMESYPEQCRASKSKTFVKEYMSQPIVVTGKIVCLPHWDTSGPQTLECAFGLTDAAGNNYALRDPQMNFVMNLPMGQEVQVTGKFESLKNPSDSKYAILGSIDIEELH